MLVTFVALQQMSQKKKKICIREKTRKNTRLYNTYISLSSYTKTISFIKEILDGCAPVNTKFQRGNLKAFILSLSAEIFLSNCKGGSFMVPRVNIDKLHLRETHRSDGAMLFEHFLILPS